MIKSKGFTCIVLFSSFILIRLCFIFFSPYTYYCEEAKQGNLGMALLEGERDIPFWLYLDSPHAGGSIAAGLIVTPFYLIFGDSYLALKMCSLMFSILSLYIIYILLLKYYDNSIITVIMAFFVLSTPHYLQKSLILIGNTNLFIFCLLLNIYIATENEVIQLSHN